MSPTEASSPLDRNAARSVSFAVRLRHDRAAAAKARRLVRMRLAHVVAAPTLEDVLIVVSELVTNAVLHGRGDIDLRIAFDGERVKGNICDEGGGFARRARIRPASEVGANGLDIVDQIAGTWGVHAGSAQIWFEIASGPPAAPARLS